MNVRPRLLVTSFVSEASTFAKMGTSSKKTKPPTHYETLEVNKRATQGEIKTAYFKLSKQYHPDKNSSDAATAKFREVAEAYEVLGNFNSRKSYDRSILTHTEHHVPTKQGTKPADPNIQYYQSQAALYRQSAKSGSTPMYDFDAWTKAHYGNTLHRNLRDKIKATRRRQEREEYKMSGALSKDFGVVGFAFFFIIALILLRVNSKTEYDQALTIRQRNELDFINQSENKLEEAAVDLSSSK